MLAIYFGSTLFFNNPFKALQKTEQTPTETVESVEVTEPANHEEMLSMELVTQKYSDYLADVENNAINCIYYEPTIDYFYVVTADNGYYKVINPEYETFKKEMLEQGITVNSYTDLTRAKNDTSFWDNFSFFTTAIFIMMSFSLLLRYIRQRQINAQLREQSIVTNPKDITNKKDKDMVDFSTKKFKDIAGHVEVKKDVQSLVDFLKNKDKYTEAGATLPKGVIFYGPPGTGKTLLAKAIAGEAGIPFLYMSGSDFVEMYVGVGAKRVRELFEKAKKCAPCIIFIDEIDAIGGKRSNNDSNGEDRKTINALLTEMDGFNSTDNILVIAATNRLEDLDPALTRPGRFTNKFCVPLPGTAKERLEIIKLYTKNKKFSEDVDFDNLAKETIGFSPAAIESLLNESAIISVQDNKAFIDKASIDKAMFKILLSGHVRENQAERAKEELELVAWHEAGHALIGRLNGKDIPKVTILSTTSGAGGVTFSTPKKQGLFSVEDLKNEVKELYAGRVAEYMLLKDNNKVTTGASNDIERATNIIQEIISSYGMTEHFGLLNLHQLQVSQSVIIEKEVELSKQLEQETIQVLTENYDLLKQIAEKLLENETIYSTDLDEILKNGLTNQTHVCYNEDNKNKEV